MIVRTLKPLIIFVMIIACAIVIMITVITVVLMTMPMISVLMITKAWGLRFCPQGRWGGKEQWRSLALHWAVCN